jgi:hypothetical protein
LTKKKEPAHHVMVTKEGRLEILLLSDEQPYGHGPKRIPAHACIFKISGTGIIHYYHCHIPSTIADGPTSDLMSWCFEHVNRSGVTCFDKVRVAS